MGIRAWFHRSAASKKVPPAAGKRRLSAVQRRNAAKGIRPRRSSPPHRSREEQYDSEFITRYGDPFD